MQYHYLNKGAILQIDPTLKALQIHRPGCHDKKYNTTGNKNPNVEIFRSFETKLLDTRRCIYVHKILLSI